MQPNSDTWVKSQLMEEDVPVTHTQPDLLRTLETEGTRLADPGGWRSPDWRDISQPDVPQDPEAQPEDSWQKAKMTVLKRSSDTWTAQQDHICVQGPP